MWKEYTTHIIEQSISLMLCIVFLGCGKLISYKLCFISFLFHLYPIQKWWHLVTFTCKLFHKIHKLEVMWNEKSKPSWNNEPKKIWFCSKFQAKECKKVYYPQIIYFVHKLIAASSWYWCTMTKEKHLCVFCFFNPYAIIAGWCILVCRFWNIISFAE